MAWGGHLATIGSAAENQVVRSFSNQELWIGYSDLKVEGAWTWADGSGAGPFQNWRLTQPDNCCGGENCAAMVGVQFATTHFGEPANGTSVRTGAWVDLDCNQRVVYGNGVGMAPVKGHVCSRSVLSSTSTAVATTAVTAPDLREWVRILSNVSYFGTSEPAGYPPLVYGRFTRLRAVYLAGYITACESKTRARCPSFRADRPWQNWPGCGDTAFSFELLRKGGTYIIEQTGSCTLPPGCQTPATPAGDIVCNASFTLSPGDLLVPTWYEASSPTCTGECRVRFPSQPRLLPQVCLPLLVWWLAVFFPH